MLRIFTYLFAVAAFVTPASVFAESLKIGVLDAPLIINTSNAAKSANKALEKQVKEAQEKIAGLEKPLVAQQKKLQEDRAVLSSEKLAEKEAELRKNIRAFQLEKQSMKEAIDRENIKMRKDIAQKVRKIIETYAKEKGFDLIIPESAGIFYKPEMDITKEVLELVNKELK